MRKNLKKSAALAKPFYELLKKEDSFEWNEKEEEFLKDLKKFLISSAILHKPDFQKKFILEIDTCGGGLGAIFSQNLDDGTFRIAYASRTLGPAEKKCIVSEKCLGAVGGMEISNFFYMVDILI